MEDELRLVHNSPVNLVPRTRSSNFGLSCLCAVRRLAAVAAILTRLTFDSSGLNPKIGHFS